MLKWTIEISVDEIWVADGFNPDDRQVQDAVETMLPFAKDGEVIAKVTKRPDRQKIFDLQMAD